MSLRALNEAIIVDQLHKCYRVDASPTQRLRRFLGGSSTHHDFAALSDVSALRVVGGDGEEIGQYEPGMGLVVEMDWECVKPDEALHIGIAFERGDGTRLFGVTTFWDETDALRGTGVQTARLEIPHFPVAKGSYSVCGYLFCSGGLHLWDQVVVPNALEQRSRDWTPAVLELDHHWVT